MKRVKNERNQDGQREVNEIKEHNLQTEKEERNGKKESRKRRIFAWFKETEKGA